MIFSSEMQVTGILQEETVRRIYLLGLLLWHLSPMQEYQKPTNPYYYEVPVILSYYHSLFTYHIGWWSNIVMRKLLNGTVTHRTKGLI